MGIDPGLANTGYGVVEEEEGRLYPLGYGGIETSPRRHLSERLDKIYSEVRELIERYQPDVVVVEQLFFNTNVRSAMVVGQARGVIILAAAHAGIGVERVHAPAGQAGGGGQRTRRQGAGGVHGADAAPHRGRTGVVHASDALALAICHLQRRMPAGWRRRCRTRG